MRSRLFLVVGLLVLLYLPTYSPWLNPIEMLWRHFRREVTHCELFETVNAVPAHGGSIISAGPTIAGGMLFVGSGYGVVNDTPGGGRMEERTTVPGRVTRLT